MLQGKQIIQTKKGRLRKLPVWLTLARIAVGLMLFWKGILFIHDSSILENILQRSQLNFFINNEKMLAYIIPYINLLGGLFIATGLFTKWSSLIQIPILIGAVILLNTNARNGTYTNTFELLLSIAVLILLVVFLIKGSGFISADEYFHSYYKAGSEAGNTENFFQ